VLFHFSDANPNATVADYTATVTWGDGKVEDSVTDSTAVQVVANPNGGFDVVGSHAYTSAASGMTFMVQVQDQGGASTSARASVIVSGDVVINGTAGDDTLVLTQGSAVGSVTYVLNNGTPVTLSDIHSFTFNGQGGNDTMTVRLSAGSPLVPGSVHFDGGPGSNSLVIAGTTAQGVLRTQPGMIDADGQAVSYDSVASVNLNGAQAVNAIAGPDTADRDAAFTGLTADERSVQALYLDNLGRAGTKAELDSWLPLLNSPGGQMAVAGDIVNSFEARDWLVKSWYQTYLGRSAAGTEEQGWVSLLQQGQSEEQVLSQILASSEFYDRAQNLVSTGTQDERYVQALYQVLLNRSAVAGEVAGWLSAVSVGLTRQEVALGFLQSQEFRTDQFEGYYNALLRRPDDPVGLNSWVMSNLDMRTVRIGFESGAEFYTNG
jgi:hypothetical protein